MSLHDDYAVVVVLPPNINGDEIQTTEVRTNVGMDLENFLATLQQKGIKVHRVVRKADRPECIPYAFIIETTK